MSAAAPVDLSGIPQTMLWTLHNRASEARRPDAFLSDPEAVRIYESLSYDYTRNFGAPDGSHAMRSRLFDNAVRPWMATHPGGTVVELACGLETQFQRCDDGQVRWLCVDVPEAIAVRERFLRPSERCQHLAQSALELSWMDQIDAGKGVFVTAQGLFMYFEEPEVRRLITSLVARFPGVELMFDAIPRWFSRKTLRGFHRTKHYRAPPMPWGANHGELPDLLRGWSPGIASVEVVPYGYIRGAAGLLLPTLSRFPVSRDFLPSVVRVRTVRRTP